jgi:hypothetical protein
MPDVGWLASELLDRDRRQGADCRGASAVHRCYEIAPKLPLRDWCRWCVAHVLAEAYQATAAAAAVLRPSPERLLALLASREAEARQRRGNIVTLNVNEIAEMRRLVATASRDVSPSENIDEYVAAVLRPSPEPQCIACANGDHVQCLGGACACIHDPRAAVLRPSPRGGCINCGESARGGYMSGFEGSVDEGAVGPFCAQCWAFLKETFVANAKGDAAVLRPSED